MEMGRRGGGTRVLERSDEGLGSEGARGGGWELVLGGGWELVLIFRVGREGRGVEGEQGW